MSEICLSCKKSNDIFIKTNRFGKNYNATENITAKWALEYGYKNNTPPEGFERLNHKKKYNQKKGHFVKLKPGKKFANRYIYAWAATEMVDDLKIKEPLSAYYSKNYINDIFGKLNKNGEITIKIRNPQIYKEKITFPPHIHYKISNKIGNDYTDDFFTLTYLRKMSYMDIKKIVKSKSQKYILLNTLPIEYFAKYKIPYSVNLSYKEKCLNKPKKVEEFFKDILINYPIIKKKVLEKKIELNEIPIIVYCANPECNAANKVADKLLQNGFVNIFYYKGGLKEYYKKTHVEKLF